MTIPNYQQINRESWNQRTKYHLDSEFYQMPAFLEGKTSLNEIELGLLGDIKGLKILHLQCHFGQDSVSLARMGAQVTGVDLSDASISQARELAQKCGQEVSFICCDLYDLPEHLDEQFDLVFTSYGTIGWLPDLRPWAQIVSRYLKPAGRFVFVEFHPVVWMFDNELKEISFDYFNTGPIVEEESGTYAEKEAPITLKTVTWNHELSDVVNKLIREGLEIRSLDEFDYSPYNCFNSMTEEEHGKFRISHLKHKIPMVYSLEALKK
ncbi:MAG: class I SAM-dependent methyltransferase [Bacteroidetes bacterium]|nr:MAG: class I SAM-dependent methyltransferase [Bacteroidota bacterium]